MIDGKIVIIVILYLGLEEIVASMATGICCCTSHGGKGRASTSRRHGDTRPWCPTRETRVGPVDPHGAKDVVARARPPTCSTVLAAGTGHEQGGAGLQGRAQVGPAGAPTWWWRECWSQVAREDDG
jgi:hypothetical protein